MDGLTRTPLRLSALVTFLCLVAAPSAWAQNERVRVSGTISAAVGDGDSTPSIGVAAGFQLARRAGLELELLYIPDQELEGNRLVFPLATPASFPIIFPPLRADISARTVAFISSFVTDLEVGRLRPYAQLGGGIANVEQTVNYPFLLRPLAGSLSYVSFSGPSGVLVSPSIVRPFPYTYTVSENSLVLTAGAGLDIRIWKRLSVAADVRYLHIFTTTQSPGALKHVTRVGARTSWWF